eukprot:gene15591-21694_t
MLAEKMKKHGTRVRVVLVVLVSVEKMEEHGTRVRVVLVVLVLSQHVGREDGRARNQASMLAEKMKEHRMNCNTGWTDEMYSVGHRTSLTHTRAIVNAIHAGVLTSVEYVITPILGCECWSAALKCFSVVPVSCPS